MNLHDLKPENKPFVFCGESTFKKISAELIQNFKITATQMHKNSVYNDKVLFCDISDYGKLTLLKQVHFEEFN